jgi:hypothetical protein
MDNVYKTLSKILYERMRGKEGHTIHVGWKNGCNEYMGDQL